MIQIPCPMCEGTAEDCNESVVRAQKRAFRPGLCCFADCPCGLGWWSCGENFARAGESEWAWTPEKGLHQHKPKVFEAVLKPGRRP